MLPARRQVTYFHRRIALLTMPASTGFRVKRRAGLRAGFSGIRCSERVSGSGLDLMAGATLGRRGVYILASTSGLRPNVASAQCPLRDLVSVRYRTDRQLGIAQPKPLCLSNLRNVSYTVLAAPSTIRSCRLTAVSKIAV